MFGVVVGHTIEIALYAAAFFVAFSGGLQGVKGDFEGGALSYFEMSAVSFTTVGIGSTKPVDALAVLAAMEALTGFSLITWSATFGYSIMRELWDERDFD